MNEIKQKLQTLECDWQAKINLIEAQKKEIENEFRRIRKGSKDMSRK